MRRRRTLLALLAIVVAVAVALLIWQPWATAETPPETAPSETAPAESPAPEATDAAEETPSPSPTEPFTPIGGDPDADASEPCAAEAVRITPQTDRTTYRAGEPVQLSFTIENTGEAACSLNAGTSVQEYEIRTGDELVYRWSDCATDAQDDIVALEPGTPQSTVPIEWDRTVSSNDTCTAEREQVSAGGAAYNLSVRVGDYPGSENRQFILEE